MFRLRRLLAFLASQAGDHAITLVMGSTAIVTMTHAMLSEASGAPYFAISGAFLTIIVVGLIALPDFLDWWLARAPPIAVENLSERRGPEAVIRVRNLGSRGIVKIEALTEYPEPYPRDQPWRFFDLIWQETGRPGMRLGAGKSGTIKLAERGYADGPMERVIVSGFVGAARMPTGAFIGGSTGTNVASFSGLWCTPPRH